MLYTIDLRHIENSFNGKQNQYINIPISIIVSSMVFYSYT